jgi:hypothetical protein
MNQLSESEIKPPEPMGGNGHGGFACLSSFPTRSFLAQNAQNAEAFASVSKRFAPFRAVCVPSVVAAPRSASRSPVADRSRPNFSRLEQLPGSKFAVPNHKNSGHVTVFAAMKRRAHCLASRLSSHLPQSLSDKELATNEPMKGNHQSRRTSSTPKLECRYHP